jgi:hypothetical protein
MVCILGMHRSGTSCIAGCLEERGLYLGEVVNAAPHNRKGNKENLQLRAINDDVLAFSGGSWDRPPERVTWNDALRRRRVEHIGRYSSRAIWGFKDPRSLLTLPFWVEANPNLRFVGTFRHPSAVALSLLQRPGLTPASPPLSLWKHYNLKLLEYSAEYQFPLVCFDWPAAVYVHALEKIVQFLGLREHPGSYFRFFDEQLRNNDLLSEESLSVGREEILIYNELLKNSIPVMQIG